MAVWLGQGYLVQSIVQIEVLVVAWPAQCGRPPTAGLAGGYASNPWAPMESMG
eukprot:CAMPEP_0203895530 /NCGR_PEP_ID=MMETSP0359-20131031/38376_1 /ASSEMBLY_ACC=CAM_ASM_000338 /TAXON_ID=268821 /ORGANISM="Scrippsiella Hangoei, Strain SHTV-5" /LENGTH=52 /DNA_ID=CAMNT_0050818021 /DNA_START=241 /DNA_END=395 /DNA_ORIENTATION=-